MEVAAEGGEKKDKQDKQTDRQTHIHYTYITGRIRIKVGIENNRRGLPRGLKRKGRVLKFEFNIK